MKTALKIFGCVIATFAITGAALNAAEGQTAASASATMPGLTVGTAAPPAQPSIRTLGARTAYALHALAEFRKAIADSRAAARAGNRAEAARLARLEAAYRDLTENGLSSERLVKACNLLPTPEQKDKCLALLAGDAVRDDTMREWKCPDGTAPSIETSSADMPGVGKSGHTVRRCVELHSPTIAEKLSARRTADAAGHATEAEAGWKPPPADPWADVAARAMEARQHAAAGRCDSAGAQAAKVGGGTVALGLVGGGIAALLSGGLLGPVVAGAVIGGGAGGGIGALTIERCPAP